MVKTPKKAAVNLLIGVLATTTTLITPFWSYDSINLPRLIALASGGAIALGFLWLYREEYLKPGRRLVSFTLGFFIVWLFVSYLFSGTNTLQSFYGVFGRNAGLLSYVSLAILLLFGIVVSDQHTIGKVITLLIGTGVFAGFYGLVQSEGKDPFDWTNPYSPVFSFFGNPNFHSSYMGITATAAFALILGMLKIQKKLFLLLYICLALFNIVKSNSQQGLLVFLIGSAFVSFVYLVIRFQSKAINLSGFLVLILGLVVLVLDIFQKAPWQSIFYKESVSARGDFWRAGWKMTTQNPFFGVGPDGYRDSFKIFRDLKAVIRPGADDVTDSAHNIFLDISSSGGFVLLLAYVVIQGLVIYSITTSLRMHKQFNAPYTALVGAWIAYQAQSIISINSLGLGIWGWVLGGLIIGYRHDKQIDSRKFSGLNYSISLVALLVSMFFTIPQFLNDVEFRASIKSGDVLRIAAAASKWPQDVHRMNYISQLLRENKFENQALPVAREATEKFPSNYEAWEQLSLFSNLPQTERNNVDEKMKMLNPTDPKLSS
jgi:O-antigen ligase